MEESNYRVPNDDLYKFLIGTWKRNLEWREFGNNFPHLRTSNTLVLIEEFVRLNPEPNTRQLKWSFSKSLEKSDFIFGYIMKFISLRDTKNKNKILTNLEWDFMGETCHGKWIPEASLAILNFFLSSSSIIVTFKILDSETIAVCIQEFNHVNNQSGKTVNTENSTIQCGNMYRLDQTKYKQ
eukprot:TRINITY_DN8317_c0_g1_i1.p1 TRINITY_DN8317_c0_g1~~TRINITY_DN8317_c0_g1_i1.p1  ORF type:complete len:182 (+),score=22.22 TRINITY_DN8317_c0_g1_i1:58-603(+)